MDASIGDRLGYHVIRRVAPPESPFAGVLARDDAGETVLLAAVGGAGGWDAGWEAAAGEHRLIPLDVIARVHGGNEVVLPWCVERLDAFVLRRQRAAAPLRAGEAINIAVCVLRGAAETLALHGRGGAWWLTADGRPVFARHVVASGQGEAPDDPAMPGAHDTAGAVDAGAPAHIVALGAVAAACRDRGIAAAIMVCAQRLGDAAAADRERAPGRWSASVAAALAASEDSLFALANAEPLDTRSLSPRPSRSLQPEFDELLGGAGDAGGDEPRAESGAWRERSGGRRAPRGAGTLRRAACFVGGQLRDATARHVDPDIAEAAVDTWQRTRGGAGRAVRRPIVVGAMLAAVVVIVGVMWPDGEGRVPGEPGTAADTVSAAAASGGVPAPGDSGAVDARSGPLLGSAEDDAAPGLAQGSGAGVAPGEGGPATGIAGLADALLTARAECADDAGCASSVYEDAAVAARVALPRERALASRPIDRAHAARELALVDDLGGVAVLRVTARGADASAASQMLIIVQTERGWRIRDVFDVSDAPPTDER
ncbi:MAG: hypothetical protein R2732_04260 [Microbacteriaceae bacterium]|mgnify:FL=1|jgi:hypothetical protein|nr:hypothetical protein [Microbacteriaceae bacterium]HQC92995.1 hypothetical protein [Microbacteriaceae bacterium]